MKLLYTNDKPGQYPDSWYVETADLAHPHMLLKGETKADVCVIGAGYTGLSAALELAKQGRDVILLEAQRVGFGASGRNGGQLGSGQRQDQITLEQLVGPDDARRLWDLAEEAKGLVGSLITEHDIDCYLRPGIAHTGARKKDVDDLHAYADHLAEHYNYPTEQLDAEHFREVCPSPTYKGGVIDRNAAHLHPLRYALGLARACKAAGVRLHEGSEVHQIEEGSPNIVRTNAGRVRAEHVILATNGYSQSLSRSVAARVMPINNFILATAPLGDRAAEVLTQDIAVADSKFVVNYFRLTHDARLLFGGGESYGYRFPKDIIAKVRKPMLDIFPSLHDVDIDYAWGGTLAITMKRLPYLARVGPTVLSASGYSGHGVGSATQAGWLMARAIVGETEGFDVMSSIPTTPFPGGAALRSPTLALAMTFYALRDRLGV